MFIGIAMSVTAGLKGGGFSPAALFTNGEPGLWLDPSDVANLNWLRNLLTWTEQFDNAVWVKAQTTVTANAATAPDGTLTADRIVETATTNAHGVYAAFTYGSGLTYTATVYAKAAERSWVYLGADTAAGEAVFFDLSGSGAVGSAGTGYTGTITSVGNGWFRCQVVFAQATALPPNFFVVGASTGNGTTSYAGNASNGILIWGAQLELGSTATEYQPITTVDAEVIARFPNATLYQDTAGTQPVTTPGQPVGLALDKSKNLALGPELVTNGTFANGITGFTQTSGNVGTSSVIAGELNVVAGAGGSGGFYQDITVVQGATYLLTVKGRRIAGSGSVRFQAYDGAAFTTLIRQFFDITTTGPQNTYSAYVRTTLTTTIRVYLYADTSTTGGFADVSLKLLAGNHATQATAGSRPIYGISPAGGVRNLLTWTEDFGNAAWVLSQVGVAALPTRTLGAGTSPAGVTACRLAFSLSGGTATTDISSLYQTATVPSGPGVFSVWLRSFDGTSSYVMQLVDPTGAAQSITVTGSWQRFQVTATSGGGGINYALRLRGGQTPANSNTADVLFSQPQVETGSTATPYQRVTTQYDVTEAGVASASYLQFDTSKFLVTPTITPGIDKAQVFSGVRKFSDAFTGTVLDLNGVTGTGAIMLRAPSGTFANYAFFTGGSLAFTGANSPSSYVAPITNILTGIGDIAADTNVLRVNGSQAASSTADQGTGNYSALPLYVGMRQGSALPLNGQIFSLITRFGANLTDYQTSSTELWVANKTGFLQPSITGVPIVGVS